MKLTVLVPSTEYLSNAGARIRYARISDDWAALGGELNFLPIDEFHADQVDCDVLLTSKCHDARVSLGAAKLQKRGIAVGVDLFDDYFSQHGDSQMARYRVWLAQLVPNLTFATCSTAAMASIVASYRPDLPTHIMNDPALPFNEVRLAQVLGDKQQQINDRGKLELCWFGMGRNPNFPVGVYDLSAFGWTLREIRGQGLDVRITLLTNAHALSASDLAAINRLPIPVSVEVWSEKREAEVLAQSHAAFIPVNAQGFSIAKSLNRAWTALMSGCQVFSAGFPLYEALEPVIYRSVNDLLQDLAAGRARLRPDNLEVLADLYAEFASPTNEVQRLFRFLSALPTGQSERSGGGLMGVIHGASTSGPIHKFAVKHDVLSIRSPFCAADFDFDVDFRAAYPGGGIHAFVGGRACALAKRARPVRLVPNGHIRGHAVWSLPGCPSPDDLPANWADMSLGAQLAAAGAVNDKMKQTLIDLFGPIKLVMAENSALPFAAGFEVTR